MGQIVRRKKKGRPSKADLARLTAESPSSVQSDLRRSRRRRNVRYNNMIGYDDYLDEEEEEEEDERRREKKKLKLVTKLNQGAEEDEEEEEQQQQDHDDDNDNIEDSVRTRVGSRGVHPPEEEKTVTRKRGEETEEELEEEGNEIDAEELEHDIEDEGEDQQHREVIELIMRN